MGLQLRGLEGAERSRLTVEGMSTAGAGREGMGRSTAGRGGAGPCLGGGAFPRGPGLASGAGLIPSPGGAGTRPRASAAAAEDGAAWVVVGDLAGDPHGAARLSREQMVALSEGGRPGGARVGVAPRHARPAVQVEVSTSRRPAEPAPPPVPRTEFPCE